MSQRAVKTNSVPAEAKDDRFSSLLTDVVFTSFLNLNVTSLFVAVNAVCGASAVQQWPLYLNINKKATGVYFVAQYILSDH